MKDLWKKGVVTEVITSKTDGIPRTIQLRTSSGTVTHPIQKLAIPESQIIDQPAQEDDVDILQSNSILLPVEEDDTQPTSHVLKIEDIAIPELTEEEEIQQYLSLKPGK